MTITRQCCGNCRHISENFAVDDDGERWHWCKSSEALKQNGRVTVNDWSDGDLCQQWQIAWDQ